VGDWIADVLAAPEDDAVAAQAAAKVAELSHDFPLSRVP
jgi:glycine/serine hydroxymethyltransferase